MKTIKAVVLNDNMGPYHFYRLKCAKKFLEATAIQFSEKDHTNFWDNSNFNKDDVVTLFSDKPITEVSKPEIKKKIYGDYILIHLKEAQQVIFHLTQN